jgi:multidrug resistance efflux pump
MNTYFVTGLRKSAKWLLLAAVVAFLIYRMKLAPAPVLAYEARPGPIIAEVMGTGTLEARVKTTISPRIQERLAEVLVDQNDAVKTGQLLARLDDGELKMQVEVAEAARVAARASLERVETDEARALAVDKQARPNHQRVSDLIATPGGVVVPGGSLLQLISTNEIWISAWVDETAMMDLVAGQPARVVFRSEPGRNYPGEVADVGGLADRAARIRQVADRGVELLGA